MKTFGPVPPRNPFSESLRGMAESSLEMSDTGAAAVSARRERSYRALVERFPALTASLAAAAPLKPVLIGDAVVDLLAPGGRLYGDDARVRAAAQVAEFLVRPGRLIQDRPVCNDQESAIKTGMIRFLTEACQRLGIDVDALPRAPVVTDTFLIVLGVGLGHGLPVLIEKTGARFVVLVESSPELLNGALAALEWQALFAAVEADGRRLEVILDNDAERILKALGRLFLEAGSLFLDGTFVFFHYPAPVLSEVRRRVGEIAQLVFMSRGFFEDERVMLTHAQANLRDHPFHLIGPKSGSGAAASVPAFVIAAGPSLDQSLRQIRRQRAGAVVFSCGTALHACLQNGIIPDYHCETENTFSTYQVLRDASERFGLKAISLVASVTIDPRAPAFFGETFFFFRDMTVSTRLLARDQEIHYTSPTGANTALRVAAAFGFRTLVLFGVDCGVRSLEHKHARSTVYQMAESVFDEFRAYEQTLIFPIEVPGNFGGTVRTDSIYNWSRLMLGGVIAAHELSVINCADGAEIPGAVARAASTIALPAATFDRATVTAAVRAGCPAFAPGQFLAGRSFAAEVAEIGRFFDDLLAVLAVAAEDEGDLYTLRRRLAPFVDESGREAVGVSLVLGTLTTLLGLGGYYIHRLTCERRRIALYRAFVAELVRLFTGIRAEALVLTDDLANRAGKSAGGDR